MQHHLALRAARARRAMACSAAATAALHVHRAAAVHEAVGHIAPTTGPRDHSSDPGRHHVEVPVQAQPRTAGRPGRRDGQAPQLVARRPPRPGGPGAARSAARSWRCRSALEAQAGGQLAQPLERGALVAGHAGDRHQCGRVAGQSVRIDVHEGGTVRPVPSLGIPASPAVNIPREEAESLRADAVSAVRRYADTALTDRSEFVPGESHVPVSGKTIGAEELGMLTEAVLDAWFTEGRFAGEFERELAAATHRDRAFLAGSGSQANLLALSRRLLGPARTTPLRPGRRGDHRRRWASPPPSTRSTRPS